MVLTRENVTAASRIMLPAYIALTAVFGLVYTFDPLGRLDRVQGISFARDAAPMEVWGSVMLALALGMSSALLSKSRMRFAYVLSCCAVTWFLWGLMYLGSVITNENASLLAPAFPWFVTTACIASMVSLLKGEIS